MLLNCAQLVVLIVSRLLCMVDMTTVAVTVDELVPP